MYLQTFYPAAPSCLCAYELGTVRARVCMSSIKTFWKIAFSCEENYREFSSALQLQFYPNANVTCTEMNIHMTIVLHCHVTFTTSFKLIALKSNEFRLQSPESTSECPESATFCPSKGRQTFQNWLILRSFHEQSHRFGLTPSKLMRKTKHAMDIWEREKILWFWLRKNGRM